MLLAQQSAILVFVGASSINARLLKTSKLNFVKWINLNF